MQVLFRTVARQEPFGTMKPDCFVSNSPSKRLRLFQGHCDDPVLVTCVSSLVDGCREYASQRDPGDVGYGPMRYCDEATFATALTSDVGQLATLIQKYRYAEHKIGDAESKCVSLKLCDDPDNPPDDFYDNFKKQQAVLEAQEKGSLVRSLKSNSVKFTLIYEGKGHDDLIPRSRHIRNL